MFIDSFLEYLKAELKYSVHTLRAYGGDLRAFEEYLSTLDESLSFENVDSDIVRAWAAAMMESGAAPASVNRRLSSLHSFYNYLLTEGHVTSNPLYGLHGPKQGYRLPTFINERRMNELLDSEDVAGGFSENRNRVIISCFYMTGIRLSELVGLNMHDVDLQAMRLKVNGKRNKERIIPFADELMMQFKDYIEARRKVALPGEQAFFVSEQGQRISRTAVYRIVRKLLMESANKGKCSPHVLRHTFATAMLNGGAELGVVKELLGHSRLSTTEVYTHLTFEQLKDFYQKAHPRAVNT
ncbi:MAG: tyrosine-type recombinase/integrase [Bacteroidaceae bacterium]|nr:tyrosine-type recombinase/integrase [Bacteroidaceae bacterium]